MKTTSRFVFLVVVCMLIFSTAAFQPAEASYPACWDHEGQSCSPSQGYTYCWNLNMELAWCTCINNRWACWTGGPL